MQHPGRAVELLLVEEDPADARLIQDAFAQGTMVSHITVVADGVAALQFLRREPPQFAGAPRADFIMLNFSPGNGSDVLEKIKTDPSLRRIPVMVLSNSEAAEDLERAYSQHANCYIRKPTHLEEFVEVVHCVEQFWLRIVTLPTR